MPLANVSLLDTFVDVESEHLFTRAGVDLSESELHMLRTVVADADRQLVEQAANDPVNRHLVAIFVGGLVASFALTSSTVVWRWDRGALWFLVVAAALLVGWVTASLTVSIYHRFRLGIRPPNRATDEQSARSYRFLKGELFLAGIIAVGWLAVLDSPRREVGFLVAAGLVGPVIALAFPLGFIVGAVVIAVHRWIAGPDDPFPTLVRALVTTLGELRPTRRRAQGVIHPTAWRREVAGHLEGAALRVERHLAGCVRRSGPAARLRAFVGLIDLDDPGRVARQELADRGRRIAAWLRGLEAELMLPSPAAGDAVESKIVRGLVAACLGDISLCEAEVQESRSRQSMRRYLPRVCLALLLLLGAWAIPSYVDGGAEVRVALVLAGLTALVTPSDAWSSAVASTRAAFARMGP